MNLNRPLLRDAIGFFGGGIVAAVAAALVFQAIFPLPPEPKPTDHTDAALGGLVATVFFCGGFIGRRAFSADFWSDMVPSVLTSYIVMFSLCLMDGLDFREIATMIALASAGIVTSTALLILLGRRFPPELENYEA